MGDIITQISHAFSHSGVSAAAVLSVLLMSLLASAFEYFVYRFVSHRSFYSKAFNICIAVLPAFLSTIILSLQSNTIVILGTIGALAILRFRTAVKDPVDMLYLLWSVHIGITCGCQLYMMTFITAAFAALILFLADRITIGRKPAVLVIRSTGSSPNDVTEAIRSCTRDFRIKSRNYTASGTDFVFELSVKDPEELAGKLREAGAEKFSLIEYDGEDII